MTNTYLKEKFPKLAKALNGAIDVVVDVAKKGVDLVADAAVSAVEFIADNLAKVLDKILEIYQKALTAAVQIVGAVLTADFAEALKIAIQTACDIAGIDSKPIFDFIEKAKDQLMTILRDPVQFFKNLVSAVGGGLRNFVDNILKHLKKGLIEWLTGSLSGAGITIPDKFDFKGVVSLALQILGLTYDNIKALVVKRLPGAEKVFDGIEKGFSMAKRLVTEGPIALWEEVKNKISDLKESIIGGIKEFVATTVIKEGIIWLLSLLNPASAIVKALKMVVDFVLFLVDNFQRIKDFVKSVYDSIANIAMGALGLAKKAVENSLARILPIAISFLANLLGLRGITKTVKNTIQKISKPINKKIIQPIVKKMVDIGKKLLKKGKKAAQNVKDKVVGWWKQKETFKGKDGSSHKLFFKGTGSKAQLMVASKVQPCFEFISGVTSEKENLSKKDQQAFDKALKKAKESAKKIDKKKAEKAKTDAAKKKKERAIAKELKELKKHTKVLFGSKIPKWEKPIFGGVNTDGFGTLMTAKQLTLNKPGKGSPPSGTTPTYDILNKRRVRSGASYYVRGHLLNEKLGGVGNNWENLTPLSRKGNSNHERFYEAYVKAGVQSGATVKYVVKPIYKDRPDAQAVKTKVNKRTDLSGPDKTTIHQIIEAEDKVPIGLTCKSIRIELDDKGNPKEVFPQKDQSVLNPIDRDGDMYFVNKTAPKPVKVNAADPAAWMTLGLSRKKAEDIDDYIANRAKKFVRYDQLIKELATDQKLLTSTQITTWRKQGRIKLG